MLARLMKRLERTRPHPFDARFGINTAGTISPRRLSAGRGAVDHQNVGYVGSQPSVVRKALLALPEDAASSFIDLGCGKGRAMAVAASLFDRVSGIELSPDLVRDARRNMAIISGGVMHYEVTEGDATAPVLSDGDGTVLFLYNSFGEPLVRKLLHHLEASLTAQPGLKLWLVYYNPVNAIVFDERSDLFDRYFADRITFSAEEQDAHPFSNTADSVVIWQSRTEPMYPPLPGHDRSVKVTIPGLGADVQ